MHCSLPLKQRSQDGIRSTRLFLHDRGLRRVGERPREAPGSYFHCTDNNQTSLGLSHPSPFFSSGPSREHSAFGHPDEDAQGGGRFLPEQVHCAGTNYSPLGEVGRQGAERCRLSPAEEGGGHAEGGMASGSISLGVRNDS